MPEAQTMIKNLSAAFTAAGVDVKGLLAKIGDLGTLTTTQKASLVGALNELKTGIDAAVKIDDAKTQAGTTWSSTKINSAINAAISALVSGAPEALDTIKEVADAINTNKDAITALQTIAAGHVKFDAAQTLNDTQKQQARENIDAVSAAQLAATDTKAQKGVVDAAAAKAQADKGVRDAAAAKAQADKGVRDAAAAKTAADKANGDLTTFKTNIGDTTVDVAAVYTAARDAE